MWSYFNFRFHRQLRKVRRQLMRFRIIFREYAGLHLVGKWKQLAMIRRFVILWWGLVIGLFIGLVWQTSMVVGRYLQPTPIAGGTYSEAVVGAVKNINPILPESGAANDLNRLIFSGLTKYNAQGEIEGDLATHWEVSADGKTYVFHLRKDVRWHDDVPFTAQDVVFTLIAIQNPDSRSPLAGTWQGVKVEARDDRTVVYTLPKPFTPFIHTTGIGVLPRHLLEGVDPSAMRVAEFNQRPIGTGPFKIDRFEPAENKAALKAYKKYHNGAPLLDEVVLHFYPTIAEALQAYERRVVKGVGRVQAGQIKQAERLSNLKLQELSVPDEVGVFFKTGGPLTGHKSVRMAIALATNRESIISQILGGYALPLSGPLLPGRQGINEVQPKADIKKAIATLEGDGWQRDADGIRKKGEQKLRLKLVTQKDSQYVAVAEALKLQWQKIGVETEVILLDNTTLQQSYIRPRQYDVLLYGINTGADPDVYAYWHSSQAKDPGLNVSAYSSPAADKALEAGRTITDEATRTAKYKAFLSAWNSDIPAVMLYSPYYIYGVPKDLYGMKAEKIITPPDRFYGIEGWAVKTDKINF
ncbi:MAG TPA: peptide ABC transporter substrate-binding protein [Candidatus Dormibacteraeota bacterium]|nr:peptide ABC transporter substrate-binding protein [Candidatus Dormibacteraeota bacterium]